MDEFSFDPKSWSKGKPGEGEAAGAGAAPANRPQPAEPAASPPPSVDEKPVPAEPEGQKPALPEAWSAVVTSMSAKLPDLPAPTARQATAAPTAALPAGDSPAEPARPALPEAWSSVVTSMSANLPDQPPVAETGIAAPDFPAQPQRSALPFLLAGSALLLAAGGGWAWTSRSETASAAPALAAAPKAPTARELAATEAPPPPTAVERAINITGPSQLAGALAAFLSKEEAAAAARVAVPALTGSGEVRARLVLMPMGERYQLERLQASYADGSGAVVIRGEDGAYTARKVAADVHSQINVLRGELDSESFYTSAVTAGLTDTLIPEFINAFGYDFNLASEVVAGDTFEVAYEQGVNASGEPVGVPQLLYASLTTRTKSVALYRYKLPDGTVGWYDGNGASTKRGLMMTPIDGARISSKFGPRFHPVLKYTRLHGGTDFAAPIGTPIYAAAGGTVVSASPNRCGGNMVMLRHDNGWETRYFHSSRYADGLHAGQRVEQGQTISYVGNTGTCTTGPHLHYEVHIEGVKVDPLGIKTDDSKRKRMDAAQLAGFIKQRDRIDVARAKQV